MLNKLKHYIRNGELVLLISIIFFSFWLMFDTFSYADGTIYIAAKAWSDFSGNIPVIRSFSFGDNFPPEYPLFPGEPIRYHFLFYALVGFLEKLGVRIDIALNAPSIFGFAGLLVVIYLFAKTLFKSSVVGILSVVFFLFNGSLSFLEFFKDRPLSLQTFGEIITNNTFPSFAPYGKGIVSAFWNLNIYTNQRHLALAYGASLLLLYVLIRPSLHNKKISLRLTSILGILFGLSFFFHMAVFFMTIVLVGGIFLLFPKLRLSAFLVGVTAILLALPQYFVLGKSANSFPLIHPGYLIMSQLTVFNFLKYWVFNLGLHTFLMSIGFLIAPKPAKKIFLCFLSIFLIGNIFQFSVEIATNHKFFNYFMIVGGMFSAYALVFLWRKNHLLKPIVVVSMFFLTFSGIIDFFPIQNDVKGQLADYPKSPDVKWIMENTPKDAMFLNSSYLYHPASLAGRKIFLGWPYFPWSLGYDTNKRDALLKEAYQTNNRESLCEIITSNHISYITTESAPTRNIDINHQLFATFTPIYQNPNPRNFTVYNVKNICQ